MSTIHTSPRTSHGMEKSSQRTKDAGGVHFNVGNTERRLSVGGGAALALFGLSRGTIGGLVTAAVGSGLIYRGVTGHCGAYQALGVNTAGRGAEPKEYNEHGIHVTQGFTVNRSGEDLYSFWKNFENLPRFMTHLKEVRVTGDKTSHWIASGPAGATIAWDAEIINDEPNKVIAWRSLGGDVDNAGSVRFNSLSADRGTEVKVTLDYIPPAGKVGAAVAWLFGKSAQQQVREDLRRFKQIMEAGEVATIEGQPRGTCGSSFRSHRS